MSWLYWKESSITGMLGYRIMKNYCRLESEIYRPEMIFNMEKNGWPGDWEGRTILALVMHAQVTKREPAFLRTILDKLPGYFNEMGYMGNILAKNEADEQQLSGHNWLLRGLMAYAEWKKDKNIWFMAANIVDTLYKPVLGLFDAYPADSRKEGDASGSIGYFQNGWHLSTDTGCAFICMDALGEYYSITKDSGVELLLRDMCRKFFDIDFVNVSMQTHATLTALRGVLRFYEATGEHQYLEQGIRIFDLYQKYGMTANYANQNWFRKPLWTEPCAIVDSYMAAMKLFKITGAVSYLKLAHRIYYNALCFAQRYNGGFGCDVCTGASEDVLQVKPDIFEAYWCCTMRGAEGLNEAASDTFYIKKEEIMVLNQNNVRTNVGGMQLELITEYPERGWFRIIAQGGDFCCIKIYIPDFAYDSLRFIEKSGNPVEISGDFLQVLYQGTAMELTVEFDIPFSKEIVEYNEENYIRYWKGEQIVGLREIKGEKRTSDNIPAETLDRMIDMKGEIESQEYRIRILFPDRGKI